MATLERSVPIGPVISDITLVVRFTGLRIASIRIAIGSMVIKLGAMIMGIGVEFEPDEPTGG